MELFITIFDSFDSLTIVTKISILDVAGIVDPTPIADIFLVIIFLILIMVCTLENNYFLVRTKLRYLR